MIKFFSVVKVTTKRTAFCDENHIFILVLCGFVVLIPNGEVALILLFRFELTHIYEENKNAYNLISYRHLKCSNQKSLRYLHCWAIRFSHTIDNNFSNRNIVTCANDIDLICHI